VNDDFAEALLLSGPLPHSPNSSIMTEMEELSASSETSSPSLSLASLSLLPELTITQRMDHLEQTMASLSAAMSRVADEHLSATLAILDVLLEHVKPTPARSDVKRTPVTVASVQQQDIPLPYEVGTWWNEQHGQFRGTISYLAQYEASTQRRRGRPRWR